MQALILYRRKALYVHTRHDIYDQHRQQDAVPDEVALSKGEHTARLLLRHDDRALLVKLKGTCLVSCKHYMLT
jgi:hypothetical protein